MSRRGRLIAFEGGEGSGKSTQATRLAERLGALCTFQPGATALGATLRSLVLDPARTPVAVRAEALLLAADRAQHVAEVVRPAIDAGRDVVTDRFTASSLAYQGAGRGLDVDDVAMLSRFATGGVEPDLVLLLDLPVEAAAARLQRPLDRLESEGEGFHRRVRQAFLDLAREDGRWVVLDAERDPDELTDAVWDAVATRWPDLRTAAR